MISYNVYFTLFDHDFVIVVTVGSEIEHFITIIVCLI